MHGIVIEDTKQNLFGLRKGEMMNNRTLKLLTLSAMMTVTVVLMNPVETNAQWNERYWRRYNKRQIENMIRRLEESSDQFRKSFDRWLDNSKMDGSEREDRYNARVKKYEDALDQLRDDFDRKDNWWEAREKVREALDAARPVAQLMRNQHTKRGLEKQWYAMRRDLNRLASTYQLRRM